MPDWQAINKFLERDHDIVVDAAASPRSVGGGDINAAWRIETATGPAFLKTARVASFDMFSAEADGLSELKEANAFRVPDVLGFGRAEDDASGRKARTTARLTMRQAMAGSRASGN